jgi:hypothetical protein
MHFFTACYLRSLSYSMSIFKRDVWSFKYLMIPNVSMRHPTRSELYEIWDLLRKFESKWTYDHILSFSEDTWGHISWILIMLWVARYYAFRKSSQEQRPTSFSQTSVIRILSISETIWFSVLLFKWDAQLILILINHGAIYLCEAHFI